jgi:N-acetylglutamate synthase-like GNAT family acetyltransferase
LIKKSIRKTTLDDAPTIAELSGQLRYSSDAEEIESRIHDILSQSEHRLYAATHKNMPLGWVHGFVSRRVESASFIEIGGLVVGIDYRNIGIGRRLVEEIVAWSNETHCMKVRVRCNAV